MTALAFDDNALSAFLAVLDARFDAVPDRAYSRPDVDITAVVEEALLDAESRAQVSFPADPDQPGIRNLYFNGRRTPVAVMGDQLLVHGDPVARLSQASGYLLSDEGRPLSPFELTNLVETRLQVLLHSQGPQSIVIDDTAEVLEPTEVVDLDSMRARLLAEASEIWED